MLTLSPSTQATYLIMIHPPLVMQDIVETILDYAPDAAIIQVRTPQEAAETLPYLTSMMGAILQMEPRIASAQVLATSIRNLGGQTVFYGDAAEDCGPGSNWTILNSPFTTISLMAILRNRRTATMREVHAKAISDAIPRTPLCMARDG